MHTLVGQDSAMIKIRQVTSNFLTSGDGQESDPISERCEACMLTTMPLYHLLD